MALPRLKFQFLQPLPLVLLLPFLFSLCHVNAQFHESIAYGRREGGMLPWRRFMADASAAILPPNLPTESRPYILAAERTRRLDPSNGSNYYTGGWNITDKHYLSSLGFTAVPLFTISAAWFFGFGLALLLACCFSCFCRRRQRRRSNSFSHSWHSLSLIMLIVLACFAITGCILLYVGHAKSHNSAMTLLKYMKGQSDFIVANLQNFASKMAGTEKVEVDQVFLPSDLQAKVDEISTKLSASSHEFSLRASQSFEILKYMLKITQLFLLITGAVILLLTFIGLLFSMLGLQFPVYFLVLLGWILVTVTFLLCSFFLIMHNMVGDTCVAIDEWVARPHEYTSVSELLPCVDPATALESLSRSKEVTFQLIDVINGVIHNVSNVNFYPRPVPPPLNYNQSGPLMPILCSPYEPDLRDRMCLKGELSFDNAPQVWKGFICNSKVIKGHEICTSVGRITSTMYNEMAASASMSQGLYLYLPFLMKLADCTFAREAFSSIVKDYCPSLERNSKLIYIGLGIQSTAMMLSLIFWMVLVIQRRERKNCRKSTTMEGPQIAGYKL